MKLSIAGLLVLGLLAAISAAILMSLLMIHRSPEMMVESEVTVLVAARDIAPNTMIDGSAVAEQKVARAKVPDQALSSSVQAIGKVTAVPVLKGQAFSRDVFVTEGSGPQLAASFPPGKRAIAVSLSDSAGLDGVLYPGSVVDVILTVKSGGENDLSRSRTVLESVPVLAIERQTVIARDAEKQDGGTTGRGSNSRRVTLMVDSRQASIVQLALSEGTISLAMRNPLDKDTADRSDISLQQVMPKKDNSPSFMEAMAAGIFKASSRIPPPQALVTVPSPPAPAPSVTLLKPKAGWETMIIRGSTVEKVQFPESQETPTLANQVN